MRMRRITVLAIGCLLVMSGLTGCKPNTAKGETTPKPTATQQAPTGKNPLTPMLVEQTDQKDLLVGEMAEMLDTYRPKSGEPDYTQLARTAAVPFFDVGSLLSDVLVLSFSLKDDGDGSYSYAKELEQASVKKSGDSWLYSGKSFAAGKEDTYQRQSALFSPDGTRMAVQVYEKTANHSEVVTLNMQWLREGTGTLVQCVYTKDDGDSYTILRYRVDRAALTYAVYENAEQAPDLFTMLPDEVFAQGYVTYGTFANGTVVIQNENHTLRVTK
jgi:hypothetical protein